MYRQFYGLLKKPFELVPDPRMLFLSETHKEALAVLRYGVVSNKSFLLLTGGIGTGKTTLIQILTESLGKKIRLCLLPNPKLDREEFFYFLASQLRLPYDGNKAKFMLYLSKRLELCGQKEEKVLLIIDEAHVIPVDLLEEIRLLSNQTGQAANVLSIFFIGQPELLKRLSSERLRPLRQRIGIRFHIELFNDEETAQYIHSRLKEAGARQGAIFSDKALQFIHQATRGNPRLINILCDHSLLSGYSNEQSQIDEKMTRDCARELNIPGEDPIFQIQANRLSRFKLWRLVTTLILLSVVGVVTVFVGRDWFGSFLYK